MTTCSVDGCERKVAARGLCSSHYNRDRVHGNLFTPCHGTLGGGPAKLSPADIGAILDRLVLGDRPAECRDTGLVHVCSFACVEVPCPRGCLDQIAPEVRWPGSIY